LKENEMQTFITNQFFILCVKRQCRNWFFLYKKRSILITKKWTWPSI
jgi:hypothetical protein